MSDALFGFDGTESPQLRSDPSGRGGWRDAPELPPLTLPAIPNLHVTREEIAAALGDDPTGLGGHDPGAMPAQQPDAPTGVPHASAPHANVPPPDIPQAHVPQVDVTAPPPAPSAPQLGGPSAAGASGYRRLVVPTPVPLAQPSPPRRLSGLRYRPPLAVGSRTPVQLGDLRRRIGRQVPGLPLRTRSSRQVPGLPLRTRSNGGASVFFFITLIIFGVLAYSIIVGIVESILRLFQ
jgi:hypothetical protein